MMRKAKKSYKPKSTKALIRAVAKKVVDDALEDKYQSGGSGPTPKYYNAAISANSEIEPLLPPMQQGTNSGDRVGDKIKPKRLRVDVVVTTNGTYNSSQLNLVRLFFLQDKSIRNSVALKDIALTQVGTPIATQLLDSGGILSGFAGVPNQIMRRVNRQRYTIFKDKILELISGTGQTPNGPNGYNGTQTFVSGQQCYRFSVVIPTPAVLKYSQAADNYPSNFAPFLAVGYVQPDGNATPDNLLQRITVNWISHLDYEDA